MLYTLDELIIKSIDLFKQNQRKEIIAVQDGQFFEKENEYEAWQHKREKKCASFLITRNEANKYKLRLENERSNLNKKLNKNK